jgi:hypothetical protein
MLKKGDYDMSEKTIPNIYQRIIQVQKAVTGVAKNEKVEHGGGYKAVSHDDVAKLLHLPLAEAG